MGRGNTGNALPGRPGLPVMSASLCGMRIQYALKSTICSGITFYGIDVTLFSEDPSMDDHVFLPELCSDYDLAVSILDTMCRFEVTPCTAENVADDLLAEAVIRHSLSGIPRI